jgi:hypothetical protein
MIFGRIYKIVDNVTGLQYIGSTTKSLHKRLLQHKNNYKCYLEGRYSYITSYKILESNNYRIELIQTYIVRDRKHLELIEGRYIREQDCVNRITLGRTRKEWFEDNKERIANYKKDWYEDNKERITNYKKDWYENNKERILSERKKRKSNL